MKRREFIRGVIQAAGTVAATALSASQVLGANERVIVGLIGCGGRGRYVAKLMRDVPDVEFGAVCDVYDVNTASAQEWAGGRARAYKDFRKLLEQIRY